MGYIFLTLSERRQAFNIVQLLLLLLPAACQAPATYISRMSGKTKLNAHYAIDSTHLCPVSLSPPLPSFSLSLSFFLSAHLNLGQLLTVVAILALILSHTLLSIAALELLQWRQIRWRLERRRLATDHSMMKKDIRCRIHGEMRLGLHLNVVLILAVQEHVCLIVGINRGQQQRGQWQKRVSKP